MRRKLTFFNVVVILVVVACVVFFGSQTTRCIESELLLYPVETWNVVNSGLDSRILWQNAQFGNVDSSSPNLPLGNLAISNGRLAYQHWTASTQSCSTDYIVGLDPNTGNELWRFAPSSFSVDILPNNSGFLLHTPFSMFLLNRDGQLIWNRQWDSDTVFLRWTRTLAEIEDQTYLLTLDTSDAIINLETGTLEARLESDIIGFYEDFSIIDAGSGQLSIVEQSTQREVGTISVDDDLLQFTSIYPSHPTIWTIEDNLALIFPGLEIKVYNNRFEELWSLNEQFHGMPVVISDMLGVYQSDGLRFYSIATGELVGSVDITRKDNLTLPEHSIEGWPALEMISYQNVIIIRYRTTRDFLALEINPN